eukprot:9484441-Pyramimonas_sp.AAC.1
MALLGLDFSLVDIDVILMESDWHPANIRGQRRNELHKLLLDKGFFLVGPVGSDVAYIRKDSRIDRMCTWKIAPEVLEETDYLGVKGFDPDVYGGLRWSHQMHRYLSVSKRGQHRFEPLCTPTNLTAVADMRRPTYPSEQKWCETRLSPNSTARKYTAQYGQDAWLWKEIVQHFYY